MTETLVLERIIQVARTGVLPESVELTSASSISTPWSNKIIGSSNGWSSQDLASSLLKQHGEPYGERKGQIQGVEKGDIRGQVTFIATLFGVAI